MKRTSAALIATVFVQIAVAEVPPAVQELVFGERLPEVSEGFVYCLSVDGEDATSSLLARLQRSDLMLVVASECTQSRMDSFHNVSGRKAMFFRLDDFSSSGEASSSVEFERYHNGRFASGETLLLEFMDGAWRITGKSRGWDA